MNKEILKEMGDQMARWKKSTMPAKRTQKQSKGLTSADLHSDQDQP